MCQPYLGAHYHLDRMLDVNTVPTLSEPRPRVRAYSATAKSETIGPLQPFSYQ